MIIGELFGEPINQPEAFKRFRLKIDRGVGCLYWLITLQIWTALHFSLIFNDFNTFLVKKLIFISNLSKIIEIPKNIQKIEKMTQKY